MFAHRSVVSSDRVNVPPAAERDNVKVDRSNVPELISTSPESIVIFAPNVVVLVLETTRLENVTAVVVTV